MTVDPPRRGAAGTMSRLRTRRLARAARAVDQLPAAARAGCRCSWRRCRRRRAATTSARRHAAGSARLVLRRSGAGVAVAVAAGWRRARSPRSGAAARPVGWRSAPCRARRSCWRGSSPSCCCWWSASLPAAAGRGWRRGAGQRRGRRLSPFRGAGGRRDGRRGGCGRGDRPRWPGRCSCRAPAGLLTALVSAGLLAVAIALRAGWRCRARTGGIGAPRRTSPSQTRPVADALRAAGIALAATAVLWSSAASAALERSRPVTASRAARPRRRLGGAGGRLARRLPGRRRADGGRHRAARRSWPTSAAGPTWRAPAGSSTPTCWPTSWRCRSPGAAADLWGARRLYVVALGLFCLGSLGAGLSRARRPAGTGSTG